MHGILEDWNMRSWNNSWKMGRLRAWKYPEVVGWLRLEVTGFGRPVCKPYKYIATTIPLVATGQILFNYVSIPCYSLPGL